MSEQLLTLVRSWAPLALAITIVGALTIIMIGQAKVGDEIAAGNQSNAVMVCTDGHMSYEWGGPVFGVGYFQCTDWKTLESFVEMHPRTK